MVSLIFRKIVMGFLFLSSHAADASSSPPPPSGLDKQKHATYINFAEDIRDSDDGLPPHRMQPLPYGKPTYPITTVGNGREQVEAHLTYFEGKYWMHVATWGCGGNQMVYDRLTSKNYPAIPTYPFGDYGENGNCGIKSYSSADLTNWQLEDFYQPADTYTTVTKPVVRYSNATNMYVMVMGRSSLTENFYYTTSKSPGVESLGAQAGAVGNESSVLFRTGESFWEDQGLTLEATGFFYHEGYWYITWGETVQNGAGYVYYHYAQNPLGTWKDGGFVSMDGCGTQNIGVNVLPSSQDPVILAGMLGYRTSPFDYVTQGNQHNLAKQPQDPIPYQIDCRIRNWQDVGATFDPPRKGFTLQLPVWQRTDNLAATMNAGPVLDGFLKAKVELLEGATTITRSFSWPSMNISWAPAIILMDVAGSSVVSITSSTNATNGCYGTMAEPRTDGKISYGTVVKGAQGYAKSSPKAQLYVYQF